MVNYTPFSLANISAFSSLNECENIIFEGSAPIFKTFYNSFLEEISKPHPRLLRSSNRHFSELLFTAYLISIIPNYFFQISTISLRSYLL